MFGLKKVVIIYYCPAGSLAEIAEEDEANFEQFSYIPERADNLKL